MLRQATETDLTPGRRVIYKSGWGNGPQLAGKITGWGEKNGETVWDVHTEHGIDHWGYLDQFLIEDTPQ